MSLFDLEDDLMFGLYPVSTARELLDRNEVPLELAPEGSIVMMIVERSALDVDQWSEQQNGDWQLAEHVRRVPRRNMPKEFESHTILRLDQ
ncbi:hypothetical protein NQ166_12340 [Microbacterium sp. zg.Y1090]|uniref:hypothetical protein n=1 Tax=Microbacterium TaxID=33882 RepID=UPI00214A92B2|nr:MULTISPECIES: hypothetical protein [unclassified Microbacterium]MCR2813877.1 hypothetical protein [Microbacterium sp. zg.Y1084]MCR2819613.1 hypothetical protein [Microbacterium sp. zg.Y1090]MDL5487452.1 hypothetical protein [Microbacterium sp. zg-Y1211]WIM28141.1 hypothetical protein QNO26_13490 [Microbacterium sp. zg-Y1090]